MHNARIYYSNIMLAFCKQGKLTNIQNTQKVIERRLTYNLMEQSAQNSIVGCYYTNTAVTLCKSIILRAPVLF